MFLLRLYKLRTSYGFLLVRRLKGTKTEVKPEVLKKLDDGYAKLMKSKSKSLLKRHLTPELFKELRTKRTETSTLLDCIQSGLAHHDSGCGVYAPDAEAYKVFADLFDPIIQDYHFGFKKEDKHPETDFGDPSVFKDIDPHKHYIASTRIRCARSLAGYPFNPCMTKEHYDNIEDLLHCTLSHLEGDLKGNFYSLLGMKKSVQQKLIDDHFLFKEGDRFLKSANASRFWPIGRAIYHNYDKTFVVWCNEEDHVRIISMQRGGDFQQVFSRLVRGVEAIGAALPFSRHDRLGFLTFCPTNLGTTIRASVHIRVPRLASNKMILEEVASKYKLQVRGTRGEHSEAEGGIYDISNKRRLGLTEFDAVKELYCGITQIIEMEKAEEARARKKEKKTDSKKTEPKKTELKKLTKPVTKPCTVGKPGPKPTAKAVVAKPAAAKPSAQTSTKCGPVAKPAVKPAAKPAAKPSAQSSAKTASKCGCPVGKCKCGPVAKAAVRPAAKPAAKPSAQSSAKTASKCGPVAKPAAKPSEKPSSATSISRPSGKTSAKPEAKSGSSPSTNCIKKSTEKPEGNSSGKLDSKSSGKTSAKPDAKYGANPCANWVKKSSAKPSPSSAAQSCAKSGAGVKPASTPWAKPATKGAPPSSNPCAKPPHTSKKPEKCIPFAKGSSKTLVKSPAKPTKDKTPGKNGGKKK